MRYTTDADGTGARLGAAIMPVPAKLGQAFQSWGRINGSPGTTPIPAPPPLPGIDRELTATAIQGAGPGGMGRPSSDYTTWNPSVYYQPELPSRFHGAINSDNQMPVPSMLPNGQFGFVATTNDRSGFMAKRFLSNRRQQQVGWPLVTPSYPWK